VLVVSGIGTDAAGVGADGWERNDRKGEDGRLTASLGPELMITDPRDEFLEAIKCGRMTPDEAEAKLNELGLPRSHHSPIRPNSTQWASFGDKTSWQFGRRVGSR
jgi:hypothetical protein